MEPRISVLIADDHPLFLAGVRKAVEGLPSTQVVAKVGDGEKALHEIEAMGPDLAILDIRMPGLSGLQVLREMHRRKLTTTDVIFLTMYDDEETFNEAMDLGVMGYVSKVSAVDDVVAAIDTVISGRHYISPVLMNLMVNRCARLPRGLPLDPLSPTERRVLKLIADSRTSKEIAEELFISQRTVENHRAHISAKLNIHGSYSLLKFALENRNRL